MANPFKMISVKTSRFEIFIAAIFALATHAQACGIYEINGIVREKDGNYVLVTAESSRSQSIFSAPQSEQPKFFPYKNTAVKLTAEINHRKTGDSVMIDKISNIERRVPDPLHPANDSLIRHLTKTDCKY